MIHFCQGGEMLSTPDDRHPTPGPSAAAAFGTVFTDHMALARWCAGAWSPSSVRPIEALSLHPAAHVLHYGSACFEGLKAVRGTDEAVRVFRLDRHVERLQRSAETLELPVPDADLLTAMIVDLVRTELNEVPDAPGSLYLRPTLIGTEANVGAAATPSAEAMLYVLASPVGTYLSAAGRPLTLMVETDRPRTTPQFGQVKAGANYAMALGTTRRAAREFGADQVLFAPGRVVQETGASNVVVVDGDRIITPALSGSFLHGVTRDSVLVLASDLGHRVEERAVHLDELVERAGRPDVEVALTGTAAGLAPVGELVVDGRRITVGGTSRGLIARLGSALADVQTARVPDRHGWLTVVRP